MRPSALQNVTVKQWNPHSSTLYKHRGLQVMKQVNNSMKAPLDT